MAQIVWSKTLLRLNLSWNSIRTISSSICHLQYLQSLDLSHNALKTLPPPSNWKCKMISKLILSHNEVSVECSFRSVKRRCQSECRWEPTGRHPFNLIFSFIPFQLSATSTTDGFVGVDVNQNNQAVVSTCEFPVEMFKYTLQTLDLSNNKLELVPDTICLLTGLSELDLSRYASSPINYGAC